MKNKKMRTWSAARLLLAAAIGLSLFIAMTPTSPEESSGCSGHDHGKLVIRNQSEWFINVDVSGPTDFSQNLDPNQTATVSNVRVGTYKWVATTTTSIFERYSQSGSASVKKNDTTTINITFPGF